MHKGELKIAVVGGMGLAKDVILRKLHENGFSGAHATMCLVDDLCIANCIDEPFDSMRFSGDDKPVSVWHDHQKVDSFCSKHRGGGKSKRKRK